VGAAFTGEYYVGLGETQEKAFEAYLQKLSGVVTPTATNGESFDLDRTARIDAIKSVFEGEELEIRMPSSIQIPLSFKEGEIVFYTHADQDGTEELISEFIDDFVKPRTDRVFMWEEEDVLNFGTILIVQNIPEMHYISIEVGK
jgi:hypothetical protein